MAEFEGKVIALTGGVGGAKLARGLIEVLSPDQLLIVANTADDFEHLGLSISPDLDSVMYALADQNDTERGWGLADESWHAMAALAAPGGESWFRLGDKDLATLARAGFDYDTARRVIEAETVDDLIRMLDDR